MIIRGRHCATVQVDLNSPQRTVGYRNQFTEMKVFACSSIPCRIEKEIKAKLIDLDAPKGKI